MSKQESIKCRGGNGKLKVKWKIIKHTNVKWKV